MLLFIRSLFTTFSFCWPIKKLLTRALFMTIFSRGWKLVYWQVQVCKIEQNSSYKLFSWILIQSGEKWRHRRKILTPAFHFNILKKYLDIINEEGEKCILSLKNEGQETIKSVVPFCSRLTLNVICGKNFIKDVLSNKISFYNSSFGCHRIGNGSCFRQNRK